MKMINMMSSSVAFAIVGTALVVVIGGYKLEVVWPSGTGSINLTPPPSVERQEK